MKEDTTVTLFGKFLSICAAVGISTWAEAGQVVACIYGLSMLFFLWWKNLWRPMLEDRGFLNPRKRKNGLEMPDETAPAPLPTLPKR